MPHKILFCDSDSASTLEAITCYGEVQMHIESSPCNCLQMLLKHILG